MLATSQRKIFCLITAWYYATQVKCGSLVKAMINYQLGCGKGTGKHCPVHAMKAYKWSRGTAPLILNLCTRWRCTVKFMALPPYPWERTPLPTE
jgi:hypothetical protein